MPFSKSYPTFEDWQKGFRREYGPYFHRIVSGHRRHPDWTLDQLRGKGKFFRCTLITSFATGNRPGVKGWDAASFEIWVEGLVLRDVDGQEDFWATLSEDLDDKLRESEVLAGSMRLPRYGTAGILLGIFGG
jgi:hypothetical protein